MLVCRIVHTRLDYFNSLYTGTSEPKCERLQVVQNKLTPFDLQMLKSASVFLHF